MGMSAVESESVTRWVPDTAPSPDVNVDSVKEPLSSVVAEADRPLAGVNVTFTDASGMPPTRRTPDAGTVGARPAVEQPTGTVPSTSHATIFTAA
jgi:hypothetical protein